MSSKLKQNDIDHLFQDLTNSGLADTDSISELYQSQGIGLVFLYKTLMNCRGMTKLEAIKLTLKATIEARKDEYPSNKLATDKMHCPSCGDELFFAIPEIPGISGIPEQTTEEHLEKIALSPQFSQTFNGSNWIHPGCCCPKGCITELWNDGARDLWASLEGERAMRETSSIIVHYANPKLINRKTIKIYLNRNVRITAPRIISKESLECIELEPGEHSLIARDYNHLDPNRRESNVVNFSINNNDTLHFIIKEINSKLTLSHTQ